MTILPLSAQLIARLNERNNQQQEQSMLSVENSLSHHHLESTPETVTVVTSKSTMLCNTESVYSQQNNFSDLVFVKRKAENVDYLEVTQQNILQIVGVGYVSVVRVLFFDSAISGVTYDVQVLLNSFQSGIMESLNDVDCIMSMVSQKSTYKFCPGLEYQSYFDHYFAVIHYHIKPIHLWERPFQQIDSVSCKLLHQLPQNATAEEKSLYSVTCKECKRLCTLLNHQRKRSNVSLSKKLQRQQPSSHFKIKYLFPASRIKRKQAVQ